MTELDKWAWFILLTILFVGTDIIWFLLASVVIFLLVLWLRPEWLEQDPEAWKDAERRKEAVIV